MTNKYISTEMLIIFTALMIIANFYYIFFEKIGFLLVLLLGLILIYVGYLYFHKVRGLLAFWIGVLMVAFTLLSNKYTIIILFVFIILLVIKYMIYRRKPVKIHASDGDEPDYTSPTFIKQHWLGNQRTPIYVYKWEDVQIQHGIGDIQIDMSKAANIKENNTIVVRHVLGKVQVIVPLNYNIDLHVAAFYGNVYLNQNVHKIENNHIHIKEIQKEDNYAVNIYISTFIGDVEVMYR